MTKDEVPNPGSEEAVSQGCTCAVTDNRYGKGIIWGGEKCWYITEDCPFTWDKEGGSKMSWWNKSYVSYDKQDEDVLVISKPRDISEGVTAPSTRFKKALENWCKSKDITCKFETTARDNNMVFYPKDKLEVGRLELKGLIYWHPGKETADCDDRAAHYMYWFKRLYPGCACAIITGRYSKGEPAPHEFVAVMSNWGEIVWCGVKNPYLYDKFYVERW